MALRRRAHPQAAEVLRPDFAPEVASIIERVVEYTMTSPERIGALIDAVDYLIAADIRGAFVECGVWRGGSMMAAALRLQSLGVDDRELFLFDTYEGMPPPQAGDVDLFGNAALAQMKADPSRKGPVWAVATLDDVERNLATVGYDRITFVKGRVEETVPAQAPDQIALLRLDTDWYESTRHELDALFPRLARGGVLIIDDYGHWAGARRATDEYFADRPIFLARVDYTCRVAVKL